MGINKELALHSVPVMWNGQEAARLRGLNPTDILKLLAKEGNAVDVGLSAVDGFDLSDVDTQDKAALAEAIIERAPKFLMTLSNQVPGFLAGLIAVAADDPGSEEYVQGWPLGLQFEALSTISRMTFNGPEGFAVFVGNVVALLGTAQGMMTGVKLKRNRGPSSTLRGPQPSPIIS